MATTKFRGKTRRQADPASVVRCYYCGAKKVMGPTGKRGVKEPTIFHKPGCKLAETKDSDGRSEAEAIYPGIAHGGYVTGGFFNG